VFFGLRANAEAGIWRIFYWDTGFTVAIPLSYSKTSSNVNFERKLLSSRKAALWRGRKKRLSVSKEIGQRAAR